MNKVLKKEDTILSENIKEIEYVKKLKFKKTHPNAILPKYAKSGDSGFDLFACENDFVPSLTTKLIKIGWIPIIPYGYDIKVYPKSGISLTYNNYLANNVGLIDNNFRNEILVPFRNNLFNRDITIKAGSKIAQGVLEKVYNFEIVETDEDPGVGRGGGYGSTGGVDITADQIRKVLK